MPAKNQPQWKLEDIGIQPEECLVVWQGQHLYDCTKLIPLALKRHLAAVNLKENVVQVFFERMRVRKLDIRFYTTNIDPTQKIIAITSLVKISQSCIRLDITCSQNGLLFLAHQDMCWHNEHRRAKIPESILEILGLE